MKHKATRAYAREACREMVVVAEVKPVHVAITNNDILAAVLARLNLWWLPYALAQTKQGMWNQYLDAWRPGKPRPKAWAKNFELAHAAVLG